VDLFGTIVLSDAWLSEIVVVFTSNTGRHTRMDGALTANLAFSIVGKSGQTAVAR
jgi:hypothetical protein